MNEWSGENCLGRQCHSHEVQISLKSFANILAQNKD